MLVIRRAPTGRRGRLEVCRLPRPARLPRRRPSLTNRCADEKNGSGRVADVPRSTLVSRLSRLGPVYQSAKPRRSGKSDCHDRNSQNTGRSQATFSAVAGIVFVRSCVTQPADNAANLKYLGAVLVCCPTNDLARPNSSASVHGSNGVHESLALRGRRHSTELFTFRQSVLNLRIPAWHRNDPGGPLGSDRSWDGLFEPFPCTQRRWPSPSSCRVGVDIGLFEAWSTFA